ncbi:MAG: hypothetical protein A3G93_10810 [Nitrospinae bacterium RIFCSPLOWO2_12_FULL_45_22]|nr:MAG: hypothetical protein A3G93_10810 [Nitrospinae bacterium RIFCSPLOWO2_12_FULL_45_22]
MKALIIGGTGPTGPYMIEGLLKRGYDVTIFHRGTHEIDLPKEVEHIHGDPHFVETLEAALGSRTFDLVIAAYGRLRYVAQVMKRRTPRFIALGGIGVYKGFVDPGHHPPGGLLVPTPEDAPLISDPEVNCFAHLMVLSEEAVMQAHREGYYNATIYRLPMVYGARQPIPMEWSVMRRILDGRKYIVIPDGGLSLETRGYAENVAYAMLLAVDQPEKSAGQIYNVGDEKVLSLYEWIVLITNIMGYSWELVNMPENLARPSRPYLSYSGKTSHRVMDITKIKRDLGYRDPVPVEEGLRRTVNWYLEHRPAPGGEVEQRLQDPFDYQAEDRLIEAYKASVDRLLQIPYALEGRYHPYAHPREPGKIRDHRQR